MHVDSWTWAGGAADCTGTKLEARGRIGLENRRVTGSVGSVAEGMWAPDAHQTACPIAQALQDRVGGTACPGDDG